MAPGVEDSYDGPAVLQDEAQEENDDSKSQTLLASGSVRESDEDQEEAENGQGFSGTRRRPGWGARSGG